MEFDLLIPHLSTELFQFACLHSIIGSIAKPTAQEANAVHARPDAFLPQKSVEMGDALGRTNLSQQ